jgi:hypothetical protein
MQWSYKTSALSEFVLSPQFLVYLFVRTSAWLRHTDNTIYFVLLGTHARIDITRLDQLHHYLSLHMKWAYKTTAFHPDSFTVFSLRCSFSIPIFRVSDLLVCWLLSWRRIKIGMDAAGLRDNDSFEELAQCILRKRERIATTKTEALRQDTQLGVDITARVSDFSF